MCKLCESVLLWRECTLKVTCTLPSEPLLLLFFFTWTLIILFVLFFAPELCLLREFLPDLLDVRLDLFHKQVFQLLVNLMPLAELLSHILRAVVLKYYNVLAFAVSDLDCYC